MSTKGDTATYSVAEGDTFPALTLMPGRVALRGVERSSPTSRPVSSEPTPRP